MFYFIRIERAKVDTQANDSTLLSLSTGVCRRQPHPSEANDIKIHDLEASGLEASNCECGGKGLEVEVKVEGRGRGC